MPSNCELKIDEELHELVSGKYYIIQKKNGFRFGTDAVLLSDFVKPSPRMKLIDFGTGTGVIALLQAIHYPDARVCAVELQEELADMARRSAEMNGFTDRVDIRQGDLRDAAAMFGRGAFDRVVCNPPYFDASRSITPEAETKRLSTTLCGISLDQICHSAFDALKTGGRLSVVYPANHIHEMLFAMQSSRLAPKRIRAVQPTAGKPPRLILLDAVKQGGSQLDWLPPQVLANDDGTPTSEWHRIYD